MQHRSTLRKTLATAALAFAAATVLALPAAAQEIKIGYSMAMTGGLVASRSHTSCGTV